MEPWQQAFNQFIASSLAYRTFFSAVCQWGGGGYFVFVDNLAETILRDQMSMLPPFEASYIFARAILAHHCLQQLHQQHCSAIFPWSASLQEQHQRQEQQWFFCRTLGGYRRTSRRKSRKRLKSRLKHTSLAAYTVIKREDKQLRARWIKSKERILSVDASTPDQASTPMNSLCSCRPNTAAEENDWWQPRFSGIRVWQDRMGRCSTTSFFLWCNR